MVKKLPISKNSRIVLCLGRCHFSKGRHEGAAEENHLTPRQLLEAGGRGPPPCGGIATLGPKMTASMAKMKEEIESGSVRVKPSHTKCTRCLCSVAACVWQQQTLLRIRFWHMLKRWRKRHHVGGGRLSGVHQVLDLGTAIIHSSC